MRSRVRQGRSLNPQRTAFAESWFDNETADQKRFCQVFQIGETGHRNHCAQPLRLHALRLKIARVACQQSREVATRRETRQHNPVWIRPQIGCVVNAPTDRCRHILHLGGMGRFTGQAMIDVQHDEAEPREGNRKIPIDLCLVILGASIQPAPMRIDQQGPRTGTRSGRISIQPMREIIA